MCCLACCRLLGELFFAMRADHQVITLPSFCSWWYCSWPRDGGQHPCLPPQCDDGQWIDMQTCIRKHSSDFKPAFLQPCIRKTVYIRNSLVLEYGSVSWSLKKQQHIFLYFLGDEGLHTVDWNNPQVGCPYPAEKGRAAEKKGQWGPGTKTGTEWSTQARRVGQPMGNWFNATYVYVQYLCQMSALVIIGNNTKMPAFYICGTIHVREKLQMLVNGFFFANWKRNKMLPFPFIY